MCKGDEVKFIFSLLFLASCATVGQSPSLMSTTPITYKKTLALVINDEKIEGAGSVPMATTYRVEAQFPAKPEIIKISTCHKEIIYENPETKTFFLWSVRGIEDTGYCPIRIDAIDLGGMNSSAFIDLQNEELQATIMCNGDTVNSKGVSVCQGKIGLSQRILFLEPVTYEKMSQDCSDLTPMAQFGIGYDFDIPRGECVYIFHSAKNNTFHRLSTLGYSDILLKTVKVKNQ